MRPDQIWQAALGELKLQLSKSTFETWLSDAELLSCEQGEGDTLVFVIAVENAYAKDWLENRLLSTIQRTLTGVAGRSAKPRFVVEEDTNNADTEPVAPGRVLAPEEAWQATVEVLQRDYAGFGNCPALCASRFLACEAGPDNSQTFVIGVGTGYEKSEIESGLHYIRDALSGFAEQSVEVRIVALDERPQETAPASPIHNLPSRYLAASAGDLDPRSPIMRHDAISDYRRAVERAYKSRSNEELYRRKREAKPGRIPLPEHNLVICGPSGTGKTHMAAAIGHLAASAGFSVVFVGVEDLIRRLLRDIRTRGHDGQALLTAACECDLLILDDLNAGTFTGGGDLETAAGRSPGASVSTLTRSDWALGEIKNLIHERYDSRQGPSPIIVTSNQSVNELQVSALDDPTISRLIGGAAVAEIPQDAVDYRFNRVPRQKSAAIANVTRINE